MSTQLDYFLNVDITDMTTGAVTGWVVAPDAGEVYEIAVVSSAATSATTLVTASIGSTAITGGVVTMAADAAPTRYACRPTAAKNVIEGDVIKVVTDGGTATAAIGRCTITIRRH